MSITLKFLVVSILVGIRKGRQQLREQTAKFKHIVYRCLVSTVVIIFSSKILLWLKEVAVFEFCHLRTVSYMFTCELLLLYT